MLAFEVEVKPRDPQLGDTLLVEIELDPGEAEPTGVSMSEETYPVFPISGNKYRALVPTTPLESTGEKDDPGHGGKPSTQYRGSGCAIAAFPPSQFGYLRIKKTFLAPTMNLIWWMPLKHWSRHKSSGMVHLYDRMTDMLAVFTVFADIIMGCLPTTIIIGGVDYAGASWFPSVSPRSRASGISRMGIRRI